MLAWIILRVCLVACNSSRKQDAQSFHALHNGHTHQCMPMYAALNRFTSEDFGGVALHPIDLLNAASSRQLAQQLSQTSHALQVS